MIETLISSRTRIKLLLKFFLNSNSTSYLRGLESEFGDSSNSIRIELNRLEKAGMLSSQLIGNKKVFRANTMHPLFKEIHNIILKYVGFDTIIEEVVNQLGSVKQVHVIGKFAKGIDSPIIDLVFFGDLKLTYLLKLIKKVEKLIERKIRYIVFSENEFTAMLKILESQESLLLWSHENEKTV